VPRRPREFIEGGIYHVYNRFARGEEIFSRQGEADRFLDLLREVKIRHQLTVFAWCLMSNHYHLAVRMGPVALCRSIGSVQARFGLSYNRRWDSSGPRWQSRFNAQIVTTDRYLLQLIAYIHLNPVTAGAVTNPEDYALSGHRDLVGQEPRPLADVDQTLGMYGDRLIEARTNYASALTATSSANWRGRLPGDLPWWWHQPDRPLEALPKNATVDERGVSTGRPRPLISPSEFTDAALRFMDVDLAALGSRGKASVLRRSRQLLATLAVERWNQRPCDLAKLLGRRADVVSRWVSAGSLRRIDDENFAVEYERLDRRLSIEFSRGSGDCR
jgi:REP element-mobilizing transposase RayT